MIKFKKMNNKLMKKFRNKINKQTIKLRKKNNKLSKKNNKLMIQFRKKKNLYIHFML